jgi:hypothetical protein
MLPVLQRSEMSSTTDHGTTVRRPTRPDAAAGDAIDEVPGDPTGGDGVRYEFTSAQAIRGNVSRTIAKWQEAGWELDSQRQGALRTELTFRRVKPKGPWQQLLAFIATHWAGFGRLRPRTQQLLLAVLGGLVVLTVVVGMVVANQASGGTNGSAAPATEPAAVPSDVPVEVPSQAALGSEPVGATYAYQGPQYEIVAIDEDLGPAELDQIWVYTSRFDYSTDEYKDQVRMIFEDVAHTRSTANLIVQVVTDREVAEMEAFSTIEDFYAEHGDRYVLDVVLPKEELHWVAWYTGGYDSDAGRASESADAFEIVWRPAATPEFETWKPSLQP